LVKENFKNKDSLNQNLIDLEIWANIFGFAFQISDDILDYDQDLKTNNPNICNIIGIDITRNLLKKSCNWLKTDIINIFETLENYNENITINIGILHQIINKIYNRIK
jgi:hypothetical protein